MREIRLYGALGKRYGRVHRLDVRSPAEAIRALCANYPAFERELVESATLGVAYLCSVDRSIVDADRLHDPMSKSFSITPVLVGAEGAGRAIAGFVLSVVAGVMIGFGMVSGNPALIGAGKMLAKAGMYLMLSGIAQMLAPSVSTKDKKKVESDYFSGPTQTSSQGGPVPVGYGRLIVGSVTVSAGITVQDKPLPTTAENTPIGGMFGNLNAGMMS